MGPVLQSLYNQFMDEQSQFLKADTGFGRALTGDSATILGTKYINFLVHEMGKGAMLLAIKDCTPRLQEVGTIDGTYIAHEMIKTIRSI